MTTAAAALEIQVGVRPLLEGNVVVIGSLADSNGGAIQTTSGLEPLGDLESGSVTLTFDGRRIFSALADGPLVLADVIAYQTGDPNNDAFALNAFETDPFSFLDFERWGDSDDDGQLTPTATDTFIRSMGSTLGDPAYRPEFDFDADGYISIEDYTHYFLIYQTLNAP